MSVLYFPGCTLKNKAANFDQSFVSSMVALGVDMKELDRWNCCGTVFSMASDDLMSQLAPIRNLLRAEQQGAEVLLAPCSMCYNTLARAKQFIAQDPERLAKLQSFMYKEQGEYRGTVDIVHPLAYLRDQIGFDTLAQKITKPLKGLKLGAYYGCLLTRPDSASIDDPQKPVVMDKVLGALGAEPVYFEQRTECCGSYQTLTNMAVVTNRTKTIVRSASIAGADALVTSCPLCAYNLDQMQTEARKQNSDLAPMPVFYFTELMAMALGQGWKTEWTGLHKVDPSGLLKEHGLV